MSISMDGRSMQLWDLLTDVPVGNNLEGRCDRRRELGQRAKDALNQTARWHGQEMRLLVRDDGWEFQVFSCISDSEDEAGKPLLSLFIPADKKLSVRLVAPDGNAIVRDGKVCGDPWHAAEAITGVPGMVCPTCGARM